MKVALLVGALVLVACASEEDERPGRVRGPIYYRHAVPEGDQVAAFGADHLAILAGATSAYATRIEANFWGEPPVRDLGPPVQLDATELAMLQKVFSDGRLSVHRSLCYPEPGVRIVVTDGVSTSEVLICFECKMIRLGGPVRPGAPFEWLDFPVALPNLVALVRRIFPDDPAFDDIRW